MTSPIEEQFNHTINLVRDTLKKCQESHLKEAASAWSKYGPVKGKEILERLYRARKLKREREYKEYTTSPCGCYRDPGGHP